MFFNTVNVTNSSEIAAQFRYFGISISIFTILFGSIGNLLTIFAYLSSKKLQTTFNRFVVNLSVVDFVASFLMLPFNLAGYVQLRWPFGNDSFTTRLQAFFYFSCGYTSVIFLIMITINRFLGVFFSNKYETIFDKKRTSIMLLCCWTIAPAFLLPFLIGTDPTCTNSYTHALTGFHQEQFLCTFICLPGGWVAYMQFVRILFQFFPFAFMVVLYSAIFWKLRVRSKSFGSGGTVVTYLSSTSNKNQLHFCTTTKNQLCATELRKMKKTKRLLIISVVICSAFMITFLPSSIINLLPLTAKRDIRWDMAASNLSWLNSALNPIIYAILNPNFRKEYLRLIKLCGKNFRHKKLTRQPLRQDFSHHQANCI